MRILSRKSTIVSTVMVMLAALIVASWSTAEAARRQPRSRAVAKPAPAATGAIARPKPLPAGPKAYTERQYAALRLKWRRKVTVEAYRAVGLRDPAWDEAALKLLEVWARAVAERQDASHAEQVMAVARPLMDTKCNDPLVLYCIGSALQHVGRPSEAEPYMRRAIEGYGATRYPRVSLWSAPYNLALVCKAIGGDKAKEADKRLEEEARWIGEAVRGYQWTGAERRVLRDAIGSMLDHDLASRMKQVYEALTSKPGADPWFVNIIGGEYRIAEAWKARGTGLAYTVTGRGWKTWFEQLKLARAHLAKAWKLHPDYPEAAVDMMTVARGAGDAPGALRLWFDRAVAAQFDYMPAYWQFLCFSRPRWGGSHEELLTFGRECLATRRFDTEVPEMLWAVAWDISNTDDAPDIWRTPRLAKSLLLMYEGMAAEPSNAKRAAEIRSRELAAMWCCGAYADARRLLDKMGGKLHEFPGGTTAFEGTFGIPCERALSQVYAATGPLRAQVTVAEALYQDGQAAAALPPFKNLAAQNQDQRVAAYLAERVEASRIESDLARGDWVSLTPAANLDAWQPLEGEWQVATDGSIEALRPNGYGTLICSARMPADFEMRGEIVFQPDSPQLTGGVVYGVNLVNQYHRVDLLISRNGRAEFLGWKGEHGHKDLGAAQRYTFLIQVWHFRMRVYLNDKLVLQDQRVGSDLNPSLPGRIVLETWDKEARDTAVLFKDVQLRRLTRQPS